MLGVSLTPSGLAQGQRLLDMFPEIGHVQVKLPCEPDTRHRLEERVRSLKAKNPALELSFHAHGGINPAEAIDSVRNTWLSLSKDAIARAADMGGRFVVFHGGSMQGKNPVALRAAARSTLVDSVEELLETAVDRGVEIHMENIYPAPFRSELVRLLDRQEDYRYMLDAIAHPNLKYCFDFGHAMIDDRGLPILAECMSSLGSVHLHENDRQNDLHLPLTELFPWQSELEKVQASGFKGPYILENKVELLPQALGQLLQLGLTL